MLVGAVMALSMMVSGAQVSAQPNWTQSWRAQWIADPDAGPQEAGVFHFRRDFDLADRPQHFPVRVSADNRYRLFVNGVEVSSGPARGDLLNWRYETVDIAPQLRAGRNVLTATVWNFGALRPSAQFSIRTAFLLQGETEREAVVDTGPAWQVLRDRAYSFSPISREDSGGYYVAGPGETMDAALYPWGWNGADGDALPWHSAKPLGGAFDKGVPPFGMAEAWQLVPRSIPPMEERPVRFSGLRRAEGTKPNDAFLKGTGALLIPARAHVKLLVDQGRLTMGHPVLKASGGKGATAMLTYAEALFDAKGEKGNRNDIAGKSIRGLRDHILFDGSADREFRPLWLRAFRYVELDIQTGDEPLRIQDFHSIFTAYPFTEKASFSSDVPWLKDVWDLDWNALRLSAFETFWDTPYYEQLQYVGDTRIESLLSVYLTGDDRLMRNAIEQIAAAHTPEGLTLSSYPSWRPQRIPSFSLWWVAMLHDHWMLRGDADFLRNFLPAMRSVIGWHEQYIDKSGMLGPMPWWNFLDWATGYEQGVPPGATNGHATAFTLQFAIVLRQAADLENALGRGTEAAHYQTLADRLVAAARERAWDPQRGLYADAPGQAVFSQQTNTLALLADAVPVDQRKAVMARILSDRSLVQASFYFRFYVDEALLQSGLADRYIEGLEPWRVMIRNGMTSTAETPEPTRSDSHAWSAYPSYHLLATVLGIRPASPGFKTILIEPALGSMRHVEGSMPLPSGDMHIGLRKKGNGVTGQIDLPPGVGGELRWGEHSVALTNGANRILCDDSCRVVTP
ncbi:family 78 glycoside hydrolase catalytic domain [Sphingobium sp. H39-3-25]|uniref:family 78 glycoside hydrolase catalytic domain n=1 Tax=Sphingobium arseniciresistens TaxID=3030834 RepID=UPI0023B9759A|nr:family 78 glycoside hydrolase catalytic domain [Sphingobium arseniciresistens]